MTNIPSSVIWFGISAAFFVSYGIHFSHIKAVGFDAYIKELIKKHDYSYRRATEEARFIYLFDVIVVFASGIAATTFLSISVHNIINPTNLW